ncbi:MAG: TIM barrel protein [Xanthobacteraceae bacterium]|nr:TIM barrel protein [Xanthobacteraceae bacterium]MCW5676752.1 TIM barrel protein [Xanthobacteraceae bacterium]
MFRFAANLNMLFGEYAFRDRFAAAYHAGFSAVELLHPYAEPVEHLKEWLIASRLECVLINTPFSPEGGDAGCAAIAGREHDFFRKIHLALSYARALSVPTVHVMAGDAKRDLRNTEAFISNLKAAGAEAAEVGVTLTIEPLNARDRPNYFLRTNDQAAEILDAVGLDNVKLQFDIYHTQITEGDLTRRIERHAKRIGHVQVAGVPLRDEPDRGEINLTSVFNTLAFTSYDGFIGCEYRPRGGTVEGLSWLEPYRRAYA